jgi:hypothetical protein
MELNIQVPDDYVPSDGEVNNLVYLTCKYTCGWPMRSVDLLICRQMAGDMRGAEGISKLVKVACEYCWDHVCGEPDDVSVEAFFEHVKHFLEHWYENTTPQERSKTS